MGNYPPYTVKTTVNEGVHSIEVEGRKGGNITRKSFFISGIALVIFVVSSNSFGDNPWISIGPEGEPVSALAINPQTPDTLYAGNWGGGVFKSTNGGTNWTPTGLTNTHVYALAINPQTPGTLYAGTSGGVFKSTNGGTNWTATNTGPLTNTYVYALAINPQTPGTLYAGTSGEGVFKSTNGGTNWSAVNTGLTNTYVGTLAINPQTPGTLYAGTSYGVFKSTNGGTNWTAVNTGLTSTDVGTLAINPQTPGTLYAGTYGKGVFKSTNAGTNWTATNTGLTNTLEEPNNLMVFFKTIQTGDATLASQYDPMFQFLLGKEMKITFEKEEKKQKLLKEYKQYKEDFHLVITHPLRPRTEDSSRLETYIRDIRSVYLPDSQLTFIEENEGNKLFKITYKGNKPLILCEGEKIWRNALSQEDVNNVFKYLFRGQIVKVIRPKELYFIITSTGRFSVHRAIDEEGKIWRY